jgi:hypothetical protein
MKRFVSRARKGNVLLLTCFLMVAMLACIALAVDAGYLYIIRTELQRSADAAAIAATWELVAEDSQGPDFSVDSLIANARSAAVQFAALNKVGSAEPGLAADDVFVGYLADPANPDDTLVPVPAGLLPNAVRVRVQRTKDQNGEIPLFYARVLGIEMSSVRAEATAALVQNFNGFRTPSDGSNLAMLPFALDQDTWNSLLAGGAGDNWKYDQDTKSVTAGSDGICEINLYPQGTGSPGNRGTVDIGGASNSTVDLARQIREGVSPNDMAALKASGRSLEFNQSGEIFLNGDTGISAGVKDDLVSILGKPRIIPIFKSVAGPGNNAEYTIIKFVGVRIVEVKLTGSLSGKKVLIQPANVVAKGGIVDPGTTKTEHVYSPVWLVR